ncbi:MAG: LTA synthase family protein, partial [bacterium]
PVTLVRGPRRYRRVVVIAVESLAAAFLDPSNPRRPKGMTPFLDSLLAENPHLNQCYSAGMDTEQGQYSLMCGRTDFEWDGHRYPGETLFSLARGSGYDAEMLYGDTQDFRDKEVAYPATLRLSRQFSRESFLGVLPSQEFCSWGGGLCDHAVLTQALNLLAASGSHPTLLLVDTLDTHPPYYWQKPEAAFPPAVRAAGPLQKSLNQLDDNLRSFFEGLKARGLYDDKTLVVVTADHFPAFGSDALALSGAPDHNTNRIPMLFVSKSEGVFAGLNRDRLSSQLDLAPTLARLMGLPPSPEFLGRDLLAKGPGRALSREQDLLRLRLAKAPEQDILLDDRGRPQDLNSPLARWYRWRLGLM